MSKYRKKPVVVKAFRFGFETYPDWFIEKVKSGDIIVYAYSPDKSLSSILIKTLEGKMTGIFGDYVIQGVHGEIYPCKPEIFEKTYEPVN